MTLKQELASLWNEYKEYCKTVKYKTGSVIVKVDDASRGLDGMKVLEEVYATGVDPSADGFFQWLVQDVDELTEE